MPISELTQLLEIVTAVAVALAAVWGFFAKFFPVAHEKLWRPIRKRFITIGDVHRQNAALEGQLSRVLKELTPNGGSSMRDELRKVWRETRIHGARLHAYAENTSSDEALFETDAAGAFIYADSTFLRWTERSTTDVVMWGWVNCVAEHDRNRVRDAFEAAVIEHREFRMKYSMITTSGNEFGVDCVARPIRDPQTNEIAGWVGKIRRRHLTGQQPAFRKVDEE